MYSSVVFQTVYSFYSPQIAHRILFILSRSLPWCSSTWRFYTSSCKLYRW